jgi:hypothetical protein
MAGHPPGIQPEPALDRNGRPPAAGNRAATRGMLRSMTIEQLVSAIRSLPVAERLRVIELAAHDIANDVSREAPLPSDATPGSSVTLVERKGLLVAHGEPGAALPVEVFDHRVDRETRGERLWGGS